MWRAVEGVREKGGGVGGGATYGQLSCKWGLVLQTGAWPMSFRGYRKRVGG